MICITYINTTEPVFVKLLRSPEIDSLPSEIDPPNLFLDSLNVTGAEVFAAWYTRIVYF